ncbi:MAG: anhydro-N-acetylmuramic acid kinase [Bacteroidia bacterium]
MKISNPTYKVIGLMSGTSLDGLDIAYCEFSLINKKWSFQIVQAETLPYPEEWKQHLISLENTNAATYEYLNMKYGFYIGYKASDFIIKNKLTVDFVSSHGHTIFHQPENKFTSQLGSGAAIASKCKLPVVCDFRSLDVALGGQGAPLVPIGDQLLFSEYAYCLNLGGFANVSYEYENKRIAYDICPVNIVMNAICELTGKLYDNNGESAQSGMISQYLLAELNELDFYRIAINMPKSLGKEWVLKNIHPLIEKYELSESDLLCTFCEHIATQIAKAINHRPIGKLFITGGGVYNGFLISCIKKQVVHEICIPDKKTIEFKEALIFAFLGVLRMRNEINCLKSVTGASAESSCGAIYNPNIIEYE